MRSPCAINESRVLKKRTRTIKKMKRSKAWKDLEREVARTLGGQRRVRVSYSESCCDVIHPLWSIECKYGKQVPSYLVRDLVTIYKVGGKRYVIIPSWCFKEGLSPYVVGRSRRGVEFVVRGIAQARKYDSLKVPLLCVKRPRQRGFCAVYEVPEQADPFEVFLRMGLRSTL